VTGDRLRAARSLEGPDFIRPAVTGECQRARGAAHDGPDDIRPLQRLLPAALLALLLAVATARADDRPPPQVGAVMPAFALFDVDGNLHRAADYTAPVLVVNFFAYWCDTWVKQLPQLRELARQQDDLHFRLIGISVDGQWSDARRKYLRDARLEFPVLLDGRTQLARQVGVRRVPTVLVLDKQRKITYVHEAYPGNPPVLEAIRKALSR
jgi:peroxiredoxin